jgi:hypothetical protein
MRLHVTGIAFVHAAVAGTAVTAVLTAIVLMAWSLDSAVARVAGDGIGYLLGPGALAAYAFGARRIHDVGFWYLTLGFNVTFYSVVFFVLEWLWRRLLHCRTTGGC